MGDGNCFKLKVKSEKIMKKLLVSAGLLLMTGTAMATKLVGLHVLDKDYLMIQFRDGEVHYRDSGTGQSAYLGHSVRLW